jgi:hypothetical protein
MWDGLIEQFNKHALAGTQYRVSEGGARSTERIVRIMAREPRLRRRMLASGLLELLKKPESASRVVRVSAGQRPGRTNPTRSRFSESWAYFLTFGSLDQGSKSIPMGMTPVLEVKASRRLVGIPGTSRARVEAAASIRGVTGNDTPAPLGEKRHK